MKIVNRTICEVVNTTSPLDGTFVEVIGVANQFGFGVGDIYIIRKADGKPFYRNDGEWQAITLTEACLRPSKWSGE